MKKTLAALISIIGLSSCNKELSLSVAIGEQDKKYFESYLLNNGDPNVELNEEPLLIHLVRGKPNNEILELFLKAGANPNILSRSGVSVLSESVTWGRLKDVETLLSYGALPDLENESGDRAILMIGDNGGEQAAIAMFELLIEYGATPCVSNSKGINLIKISENFNHSALTSVVKEICLDLIL